MSQTEDQMRQLLLEAIDEGLLMLGDSSRKSIYFHLTTTCSLAQEDIPDKPEIFVKGLRKIFGAGAKVVEESIAKSLCNKFGITYGRKNAGFIDYLNEIKRLSKMI